MTVRKICNMRNVFLTTTLCSFCGMGATQASIVVSESFDYLPGTALSGGTLNGGSGWAGAWSVSGNADATDQIESADMTPPTGYLGESGNQLVLNTDSPAFNVGVIARRDLASSIDLNPASEQTLYVSFLLRRDDGFNGGGSENSRYFELLDSTGNVVVYAGTTSLEAAEVSLTGFSSPFSGTAGEVQLGVDTLGVVKLVLRPSGQNDEVFLTYLVDGDDISVEPTSWMASTAADIGGLMTAVSVSPARNTDLTRFDELRIGTDFASVVPEPGSSIMVLTVSALVVRSRRVSRV